MTQPSSRLLSAMFAILVVLTTLNAAYLAAYDSATIFYHVNVIAHVLLGAALAIALLLGALNRVRRGSARSAQAESASARARTEGASARGDEGEPAEGRPGSAPARSGRLSPRLYAVAAAVMAGTGLWLVKVGTSSPYLPILRVHVAAAVVFLALLPVLVARLGLARPARAFALLAVLAVVFPAVVRLYDAAHPLAQVKITNPSLPPIDPYGEGGGEKSPFFPSSNRTASGELIRSDFFLESKACGNKGCHPDITTQWESSAHHFSSFNNQWYRKSIEYMQDVIGTKSSKWCGGCHDMAILLTGRMDTPIRQQINTPEAQAGIGCLVCHSIVHVSDTMGQGGFTLEYPEMHRLVASKNPLLQFLHDRMVLLDPGPHKATMLKPFHRQSTPEFCSACHKVHLDGPVNHWRWFRGFNDYDAWQQSGISMQGARAFYYPPDGAKKCGSCHMPLVRSDDKGNIGGMVHSHRFPAANTAVPFANKDDVQFDVVKKFLQDGILTVDIFAVSEESASAAASSAGSKTVRAARVASSGGGASPKGSGSSGQAREIGASPSERSEPSPALESAPVAQSMLPEEGGFGGGYGAAGPVREVVAPIDRAATAVRPGSTVVVDVVARTRKIGHFFPGGTVDAFDVWLELKAEDAQGRVLFWNGWVADDGKGPVDPGAHFYRALLLDDHGNRINKRNAWAAKATVYARLIPPGSADTVHFRLRLPPDVAGPVKLTARMNYRKFSWWYTQFSFAGVRDPLAPEGAVAARYDDGRFLFKGDTSGVSGKIKSIPDLPVIVVAQDTKLLRVGPNPASPTADPKDRERWNDYGIGLLLQRDYKAASAAFERVTSIEPGYADGWVNRARVAIEEGDHGKAIELLDQAIKLSPDLPKAHYFRGLALRTFGRYEDALADLRRAESVFPRDRVVLNAIGRVLFLQRNFAEAALTFKRTLAIDPEDVTAHYNLMLCYRGLHDEASSKIHEKLYQRFKIDESAQSVTQSFRLSSLDDNRERQAIHEHDSTWTPENLAAASGGRYGLEIQHAPVPAPPTSRSSAKRPPAIVAANRGDGAPSARGE